VVRSVADAHHDRAAVFRVATDHAAELGITQHAHRLRDQTQLLLELLHDTLLTLGAAVAARALAVAAVPADTRAEDAPRPVLARLSVRRSRIAPAAHRAAAVGGVAVAHARAEPAERSAASVRAVELVGIEHAHGLGREREFLRECLC